MFKRLLKEPLLHFTIVALAIFTAYDAISPSDDTGPSEIVVTSPKIEQLVSVFAKAWQRSPSPKELKGLIDGYVKEEIDVREALSLGLEQNDTIIRRRLQQKLQFITDAAADSVEPTDADLQAYLEMHAAKFDVVAQTGFQQVFLNPAHRGQEVIAEATAILAKLQTEPALEPSTFGDASLLPTEMPPTDISSISKVFGPEFAAVVSSASPGRWIGPVESSFGLHLILVKQQTPGQRPALKEVRDVVLREWNNHQRQVMEKARIEALLKRYRITIQTTEVESKS